MLKKIAYLIITCAVCGVIYTSCGGDDSDEPQNLSAQYEEKCGLFQNLKGTSWKLGSDKYYDNGKMTNDKVVKLPECKGDVYTFSTAPSPYVTFNGADVTNAYSLRRGGDVATWLIMKGNLFVSESPILRNFLITGGAYNVEFSGSKMMLYSYLSGELHEVMTFERTYSSEDSGGSQSGSDSSYEKPEIGLEDYTCYNTSITLKYRIYNQDEAKVTSAKGYYGTSSPSKSTSATVSGSLITVRASGLKKGTTYYFKCTAKGKGGSATSETTRLSTTGN